MSDSAVPLPGLRILRHLTWWSLLASVLGAVALTALTAAELGLDDLPVVATVALVTATVLACVASAALFHSGVYGTVTPWARWLIPIGATAALAAYVGAVASGGEIWPWVIWPAMLTSGVLVAAPWPRLAVAAIGSALTALCTVIVTPLAGQARWGEGVNAVVAMGLCITGVMVQVWVWEIASREDRARAREADTAVMRERLRFAAELHDIQGHSLQVIVLKSELAARLAPVDPVRAAAEMRDVESLARDALRDTREVAHGYRAVSLATEISNAVRVLAAAGVRCDTRLGAAALVPAGAERLLALVVREATTNIIRHSAAGEAGIALESTPAGVQLSVGNDVPLTVGKPAAGDRQTHERTGDGLSGLAQRFEIVGGRLAWVHRADRFEVTATLPHGLPPDSFVHGSTAGATG